MERVSTIEGTTPVIIAAPHGHDDTNTAVVAEALATYIDGYAVINRGWRKATYVDWLNDLANCNSVPHLLEDVVKDEFLDPLLRYTLQIRRSALYSYVFIIHGVGNHIRQSIPDLDVIIGAGKGSEFSSFSCEEWRRDALVAFMLQTGLQVYEGVDSKYAGRGKNNLNQLFRRWTAYTDPSVQSMQLEIVRALRHKKSTARATAFALSKPIMDLIALGNAP